MDETAIYRKTAKGQEEITNRTYRLPARLRSLLVMVDGKGTGAELRAKGKAFGDSAAFIEQLIAEGFIEPTAAIPPTAAEPAPPAAAPLASALAAAPASADATLKDIIRFASQQLIAKLGPSADSLTGRLDVCRNRAELGEMLEKCRDAVQAMAGRRKAEEFAEQIAARIAQA